MLFSCFLSLANWHLYHCFKPHMLLLLRNLFSSALYLDETLLIQIHWVGKRTKKKGNDYLLCNVLLANQSVSELATRIIC